MRLKCLPLLFAIPASLSAAPVDLVKLGKETFHAVGCAECHSEAKNDNSVKTGPGLFGLFPKESRKRDIIESGENHKHTITADLAYFQKSLREPATEIAISEVAPTKGTPFLPVMPGYPEAFLNEQKAMAIYHYLETLNDDAQRGPAQVMAELQEGTVIKDIHQDPTEILVTDRTRIFRARIPGSSARAVHVGMPGGLNFSFDPRTMSISKAWTGGFLNLKNEMSGRGNNPSSLGHKASEITLAGHPTINSRSVDLSFKSPLIGDGETIEKNLWGEADFSDELKKSDAQFIGYDYPSDPNGSPTFHYSIGQDQYSLTFFSSISTTQRKRYLHYETEKNGVKNANIVQVDNQDYTWTPNPIPSTLTQKIALTPISGMTLLPGYSAERVPAPTDPHGRPQLFEPTGMDLDPSDGSLVVTTRTAGVWRLKDNTWTMFADGLLDALGVIVEKDRLVVGQKPELTALYDKNGDGFYETYRTLSDDFLFTANYHGYLHGPAKDSAGNYYYSLNLDHRDGRQIHKANGNFMGSQGGYRGWVMQVTPDGKTIPYAMGVRSPAGLASSPDGVVYHTENQGEYNGTSKLHRLKKGAYYGHPSGLVDLPGMKPDSPEIAWDKWSPKNEPAVALMPHSRIANSPGSPAWDTTGGKFGPFAGHIFCGDQTLSTLFRMLPKENNEAAVIHFGEGFPSGVMRLCFDKSGSLYVGQTGRGWRARGGSEHALVKLTYTKNDDPKLQDITREGEAFTLHFSGKAEGLPKVSNLTVESWFYHDKPNYGSPENNKQKEVIVSQSREGGQMTITLAKNPKRQAGPRVFRFSSKDLPKNRKDSFEAYYTISK
ncbi:MAG: hypothetical protein ACI8UZ_003235 [Akkermansiaceae bacterium]|jgi:hypothetical protein